MQSFFEDEIEAQLYERKQKKVREKFRECHNHKLQPFPDTKRKRKTDKIQTRRGNRNAKRTEKHNNKMTQGKKKKM